MRTDRNRKKHSPQKGQCYAVRGFGGRDKQCCEWEVERYVAVGKKSFDDLVIFVQPCRPALALEIAPVYLVSRPRPQRICFFLFTIVLLEDKNITKTHGKCTLFHCSMYDYGITPNFSLS